jgi:hypothetical protein
MLRQKRAQAMLKAAEERNERMPRSARQAYDFNATASTATVQIVGKTVWMLIRNIAFVQNPPPINGRLFLA